MKTPESDWRIGATPPVLSAVAQPVGDAGRPIDGRLSRRKGVEISRSLSVAGTKGPHPHLDMADNLGWGKAIGAAFGWVVQIFQHWLTRHAAPETLSIVPYDEMNRWMGGTMADKPGMYVESRWFVANPSAHEVRIVEVTLTRLLPRTHWWSIRRPRQITPAELFLIVSRGHRGSSGQVVIPPHQHVNMEATFFVTEPLPDGTSLEATTTFVDGFGVENTQQTTYPNSFTPGTEHRDG